MNNLSTIFLIFVSLLITSCATEIKLPEELEIRNEEISAEDNCYIRGEIINGEDIEEKICVPFNYLTHLT